MKQQALNVRRLRALIWKEGIQIINDPSSILIAFVLPVVLLFLFGYAVSLDSTRLRVGIALAERSPESASLVTALSDSKYFDIKTSLDRRALETDLVAGRLRGVIVIPSDFSQNLMRPGEEPTIQVIADGSEPNTANFVQNFITAAVNIWSQERGMETGNESPSSIGLQTRVWFNPSLESKNYLVPGSIAIVLTMIATLLTALVVAREWERGTMEALMATPVRIQELILGKLIPYFCLGIGSMAFCTFVALSIFRVPLRGSFVTLTLITSVFSAGRTWDRSAGVDSHQESVCSEPDRRRPRLSTGIPAFWFSFRNQQYARAYSVADLPVSGAVLCAGPPDDLSRGRRPVSTLHEWNGSLGVCRSLFSSQRADDAQTA